MSSMDGPLHFIWFARKINGEWKLVNQDDARSLVKGRVSEARYVEMAKERAVGKNYDGYMILKGDPLTWHSAKPITGFRHLPK